MARRYQVLLHASGLLVPTEDGQVVRGFYTNRRVMATNPQEAKEQAIAALRSEEKFQNLLEADDQGSCSVCADSVWEVSWFQWHFSNVATGFAFYMDEDQS